MEALPILLFAFLAVCSMPSALALECYACTNVPGFGGSKCDSDSLEKITCPPFANRCFTIKASMKVLDTTLDMMMRNCTSSLACDPKSDFNTCTLINITGAFSSCELKCCEGNLCDPYGGGATTSAVSVLAASFGAILVALNMLA